MSDNVNLNNSLEENDIDIIDDTTMHFGCIDIEPDPRNYEICQFVPDVDTIEDTEFILDLPELQIIKNQNPNNACVGFASTMALSVAEYQLSNKWIVFDPYMVYGSRGGISEGMPLESGAKILLNEGGYFESDFGKTGDGAEITSLVTKFKKNHPELVEQAKTYAIEGYAEVRGCTNTKGVNEIKTALKNNMPVLISYKVTGDIYSADVNEGVIPWPHKNTREIGSHAMLIVGWRMIGEDDYWIVVNSWGTRKGKKGLYFINCNDRYIKQAIAITNNITPAKKKCKKIEFTIGNKTFLADGEEKTFESVSYIKDSRTYLPVRFVAENLGATVVWDADKATATIKSEEVTIVITEGSRNIIVNGETLKMDVAPEITAEGRMMLPIRFVAEALNCKVEWIEKENKAIITSL